MSVAASDSPSPTPPLRRRRAEDDDPFISTSAESLPAVGSTPKKRRQYASTVPSERKRAAQLALSLAVHPDADEPTRQYTKEHAICSVSGASDEMSPIQTSHVIAKSVDGLTLTKLEWAWNMDYYTLNLDSSKNLQPLTTPIHTFFDKGTDGWFWLPVDSRLMSRLHTIYIDSGASPSRRNPKAEYKSKKTFDYVLIPFEGMKHNWDMRQSWMSVSPPPSFTASRDSKVPPTPGQPRPSRTRPTQNTGSTLSSGIASDSASVCSLDSSASEP
ncbi:hypothetical protein ONZ45_g9538 [Pleurotus djamor]|nr:hypothetical protein ONZ45_g9538 [Pleurotus djamor]